MPTENEIVMNVADTVTEGVKTDSVSHSFMKGLVSGAVGMTLAFVATHFIKKGVTKILEKTSTETEEDEFEDEEIKVVED